MTREDINDIINAICPNDEDYEKPCISPKYLRQELEQLALDQKQWNEEPTTKNNLVVDNQNIRLIDANALIKRLRPKHFDWWGEGEQDDFSKGNNSMLEEVIEAIEEFPSVTPIRPKGHWIEHPRTKELRFHHIYECSACKTQIIGNRYNVGNYKYCPHCGIEFEVEE